MPNNSGSAVPPTYAGSGLPTQMPQGARMPVSGISPVAGNARAVPPKACCDACAQSSQSAASSCANGSCGSSRVMAYGGGRRTYGPAPMAWGGGPVMPMGDDASDQATQQAANAAAAASGGFPSTDFSGITDTSGTQTIYGDPTQSSSMDGKTTYTVPTGGYGDPTQSSTMAGKNTTPTPGIQSAGTSNAAAIGSALTGLATAAPGIVGAATGNDAAKAAALANAAAATAALQRATTAAAVPAVAPTTTILGMTPGQAAVAAGVVVVGGGLILYLATAKPSRRR